MTPTLVVSTNRLTQVLDSVGPNVKARLEESLGRLGKEMASDARSRAQAHIRFIGAKKPGSYVASITGGLAKPKSKTRTTGYVRSGHPLAHLMEDGFNITDILIAAKNAGEVMAFWGSAGLMFREYVHRHATHVQAYPAIHPAFEARRADVMAAIDQAGRDAATEAHK